MPDWKTYIGEGPWEFSKSQAEAKYNVGNDIKNAGEPVWLLEDPTRGTKVTPIHHPNCGMWMGLEAPGLPPPPKISPVHSTADIYLTYIAWTPNYGGIYGRFVGILSPPMTARPLVYYSDNGGVTWNTIATALYAPGKAIYSLTYFHETNLFVATGSNWPSSSWTATSVDGLTWTLGTNYTGDRVMSDVEWCYKTGRYYGATITGGDATYLYSSADGLVWTLECNLGLYLNIRGIAFLDPTMYLLCQNYNIFKKSNLVVPIVAVDLTGAEIPVYINDPYRGEAISDNNLVVYDMGYFKGGVFTPTTNPVTNIDYNPLSHPDSHAPLFASLSGRAGRTNKLSLSRDGINWIDTTVAGANQAYDLAVGFERVVGITYSNYVTITIVS